jgi:hypothetical protein
MNSEKVCWVIVTAGESRYFLRTNGHPHFYAGTAPHESKTVCHHLPECDGEPSGRNVIIERLRGA